MMFVSFTMFGILRHISCISLLLLAKSCRILLEDISGQTLVAAAGLPAELQDVLNVLRLKEKAEKKQVFRTV